MLEQTHGRPFVGKSVHDTCATLLSFGESGYKAADKIRADFKIPERRYWWLRIRGLAEKRNWMELEKLSKSKKSPIGYGPFVDVCLENNNVTEAIKYLPKVSEDLKIKYYMKAGYLLIFSRFYGFFFLYNFVFFITDNLKKRRKLRLSKRI